MDEAQDEIEGLLRRRRHVKPSEPDNFGLATAESIITEFRQIISTVGLVMVVISSIGLLVGGIGVMDIMLDVGYGTHSGDWCAQGRGRTSAGHRLAVPAGSRHTDWIRRNHRHHRGLAVELHDPNPDAQPAVNRPIWSVIAGFAVSSGVGLFFGLWPALKAADSIPSLPSGTNRVAVGPNGVRPRASASCP